MHGPMTSRDNCSIDVHHLKANIIGGENWSWDSLFNHPLFIDFQSKFPYKFNDKMLLVEALCHRSFVFEFNLLKLKSYERLEFLGDAILGLIVTSYLDQQFPDLSEGEISKLRSSKVCTESFAKLGKRMGLDKIILLGKGEIMQDSYLRESLLADCTESLMGAVYKDSSYTKTAELFQQLTQQFDPDFFGQNKNIIFDYKSTLQEWSLAEYKITPSYDSTEIELGVFEVVLILNNKVFLKIQGPSKKKCEKELALRAMKLLNIKTYKNPTNESEGH